MILTRHSRRGARRAALAVAFTLGLPLAALVLAQVAMAASPTWGPIRHVVDGGRPAAGGAIATTLSREHRWIHAVWRRNAGRVEFARSKDGGATWSTTFVLNNSEMIFGEPVIARSGRDLWVAYAKVYEDPDTGALGRAIVVRHNGGHGRASEWDAPIRLTSRAGDVRSPSITASGSSVYLTFSDLRNDSTRVVSSHDGGRVWTSATVGLGFDEDFEGVPTALPVIAAAGDQVLVAWLADGNLATARVSTDGGDHWSDETALGEGLASAAARGGRLAILGSAPGGDTWLRMWSSGDWADPVDVPEISLGIEVAAAVAPDLVLQSDHRVGIVYSAQVDVDEETADTWEEITWVTSSDDGATWHAALRVSRAGGPDDAYVATKPTAVWLENGRLWIAWDQEKVVDPGHRFFAVRERS
jgi:hypothetical protein